jgi:hypothetical protein
MTNVTTNPTKIITDKERTAELVKKIKSFGYPVYLSEKGNYGFFTNADGSRIVSFQIDYFFFNFSANHKSIGLGTGYRITNDEKCLLWEIDTFCTAKFLESLINAPIYRSRRKNEKFLSWTTLDQHLASYQSSSKYQLQ